MARTSWVGKAQAVAGVYEATVPAISPGQRIALAINNKSVSYTAVDGDTTKTAAAGLASAWNASTEPEHLELTASASGDKVVLTGATAGVPHTLSSDSTGGTGAEITITRLQAASAAVNQKQYVELPGSPSGGTWKLGFFLVAGSSTIAYNASAATVESHLEGLSEVGSGNVTVTGGTGGPYTIEFVGDLAGVKMPVLLVDADGLTLATSDVTVDVDVTEPWLENVMAWEIEQPTAAWALKQGTRETWVLESGATIEEIEQAVLASLDLGEVRVDRTTNSTGTAVFRIYRRGPQSRNEPDRALELVTWTDAGGTAGRNEADATIYQDPAETLNADDRSYTAVIRFRPNVKVTGKALINGSLSTSAYAINDPETGVGSAMAAAIGEALDNAKTAGSLDNSATYTQTVTLVGQGSPHQQDQQVVITSSFQVIEPMDLSFSVTAVAGVKFYADTIQEAIAGKNEVHKITLANATGGSYTLTNDYGAGDETTGSIAYNATAAAVESAIEALTTPVPADIAVFGNAGGPYTMVWGGAFAANALELPTAANSLTNTPAVALTVQTKVAATGPNHFDAAKNWSGGAVPSTGDTLVFRDTDVSLLYALSQAAITPAAIEFLPTFLGTVGLPDTNENGYPEYRSTALRIGQASDAQTIAMSVRGGSNRIRIDNGDCPVTLQIADTGVSDGGDPAAFRWTGTAATNTVVYLAGSVFLGSEIGSASAIATLRIAAIDGGYGSLELASGLVITTVQHTGGDVTSRATITTANLGGSWTQDGGAITTLTTLPGGSVAILGSPTITTLDVGSDGSIDFKGANAPTATTTRMATGAELLDPQGAVTYTNGITLVLCGLSDVSLDLGQGRTIEV